MELFVGPALALIGSMFFTVVSAKGHSSEIKELRVQIERVQDRINEMDEQAPKKMLTTVAPIALAVQKLQQEIGV